jgi:acyl-CoA synthetase (AMP-forming)/AMP-acid ligase II
MIGRAELRVLRHAGVIRRTPPGRIPRLIRALRRWGRTPAAGYAAGAVRTPDRVALIDDLGALTWAQVDARTDRLASELHARGIREGNAVGLLARNGRGLVEGVVALNKAGADVLYLNTGFGGPQMAQILDREKATAVLHDAEFTDVLSEATATRTALTTEHLDELAGTSTLARPASPSHTSRQVILTSGTTGAPRGAARSGATLSDAVAALSRIPLRARETTVIAAPVFHSWGLSHLSLAMLLGSTIVLQRHFDPHRVLAAVQEHRATALVVVPVMLEQLIPAAETGDYDLSSLRVIASSGSALPGGLATRTQQVFGPVLHNLYGSTEVAYAAVATPEDLQANPNTAGKPPLGVTLKLLGDEGIEVPAGAPGRIFVASGMSFAGYTDGSDKTRIEGLVSTGDLGVIDEHGRLTVLGRDDDMVVIGGENVYPSQVEDVLLSHPSVADVAVVPVDDPSYGARLVAHIVPAHALPIDQDELTELVRTRLARFAVPRQYEIRDSLPRNATGKIVKRQLG